jgi:hypothetical protein
VAALALPASALAMLTPADAAEIERLYLEGQDRYAANDFAGAAEQWTALLSALPERPTNREVRVNVLVNVIWAHLEAYRRTRMDDGQTDIEHLRKGQAVVDAYRRELREVYGEDAELHAAIERASNELEAELTDAEARDMLFCLSPCLQPCLSPCLQPLQPSRRGCGDDHRGTAVLGALVIPSIVRRRRKDVLAELGSRLPADVVQRLQARLEDDPEDDDA